MAKTNKFQESERVIFQSLLEETDRGCVLAAHGYLDSQLEDLLRERFLKDGGDEREQQEQISFLLKRGSLAPLSSFYVKASMAFVLGAIDKELFVALTKLNELRRHFAHYHGRVTLTVERSKSIYDALSKESMEVAEVFRKSTVKKELANINAGVSQDAIGVDSEIVQYLFHKILKQTQARDILTAAIFAIIAELEDDIGFVMGMKRFNRIGSFAKWHTPPRRKRKPLP